LCMKVFAPNLCECIKHFTLRVSIGMNINADIRHYFQTQKVFKNSEENTRTHAWVYDGPE
jgi:hypothetical protein